jgi:hypothetical protein
MAVAIKTRKQAVYHARLAYNNLVQLLANGVSNMMMVVDLLLQYANVFGTCAHAVWLFAVKIRDAGMQIPLKNMTGDKETLALILLI